MLLSKLNPELSQPLSVSSFLSLFLGGPLPGLFEPRPRLFILTLFIVPRAGAGAGEDAQDAGL